MKILITIPSIRSGGAERSMITLGNSLAEKGNDVTLLACEPFDASREVYGLLSVDSKIKKVSLNKHHVRDCFFKVARFIKNGDFDVVLSTIAHMNVMMSLSKFLNFQKHKLCIRDCSIHEKPDTLLGKLGIALMRFAYGNANALVCVSKSNATNLKTLGISNQNTYVIYNTVASEAFFEKAEQKLPTEFSCLENEPFLTTVARLDPIKNQSFMIRSFAKISNRIPHKFVIVGAGPLKDELENLVSSLGIADRVIFAGYQSNPLAFMKRADLYLMSSLKEAASRSAMEALCLGTPTICVDTCGSFAEILDNGKCGIILDDFDEDAYANAILRELTHPTIKKSDLKIAAKKFEESENLKKYENLFLSLVQK